MSLKCSHCRKNKLGNYPPKLPLRPSARVLLPGEPHGRGSGPRTNWPRHSGLARVSVWRQDSEHSSDPMPSLFRSRPLPGTVHPRHTVPTPQHLSGQKRTSWCQLPRDASADSTWDGRVGWENAQMACARTRETCYSITLHQRFSGPRRGHGGATQGPRRDNGGSLGLPATLQARSGLSKLPPGRFPFTGTWATQRRVQTRHRGPGFVSAFLLRLNSRWDLGRGCGAGGTAWPTVQRWSLPAPPVTLDAAATLPCGALAGLGPSPLGGGEAAPAAWRLLSKASCSRPPGGLLGTVLPVELSSQIVGFKKVGTD